MSLRRTLRLGRAVLQSAVGTDRRARARLDGRRAAVLMYHRVMPTERAARDAVEEAMFVTPETFAHHCQWLAETFNVLPLSEIERRMSEGRPLPQRACAITFDDGWSDNLEFAVPELERRGLPATIFVVADRVGTDGAFWPDEVGRRMAGLEAAATRRVLDAFALAPGAEPTALVLEYLKRVPEAQRDAALDTLRAHTPEPRSNATRELMDWDELDRVAQAGLEIESHGSSHAILTGLDDAALADELTRARDTLRDHGHGSGRTLAYPSGAFDARVVAAARDAGYRAAVTTAPGLVAPAGDPLCWPRIGLHEDIARSRVEFLYAVPGSSKRTPDAIAEATDAAGPSAS